MGITVAMGMASIRASNCEGSPEMPAPSSRITLPGSRVASSAEIGGDEGCLDPNVARKAPSSLHIIIDSNILQQKSAAGYSLKPMEPDTSGCTSVRPPSRNGDSKDHFFTTSSDVSAAEVSRKALGRSSSDEEEDIAGQSLVIVGTCWATSEASSLSRVMRAVHAATLVLLLANVFNLSDGQGKKGTSLQAAPENASR